MMGKNRSFLKSSNYWKGLSAYYKKRNEDSVSGGRHSMDKKIQFTQHIEI